MRRLAAFVLATGCSFSSPVTPGEPADVDAAVADASPGSEPPVPMIDAALLPACAVGVTTTPGTDRGRVGGGGGSTNFPPLRCTNAADRIIGIGIRMSNQDTVFGDRSARGLSIACATVTIDPNTATATVGTAYTLEVLGNGNQGWEPSTLFAPTLCPAGSVVNGLRAFTGDGQNIFANVDMRCGKIDGTNAATVMSTTVHVTGSLDEDDNPVTVNCNANEILYQLTNRTGSGFDSANLYCAPARCL